MARRTAEQLRLREESLKSSNQDVAQEALIPRVEVQQHTMKSPMENLKPQINTNRDIEIAQISQPQMNQPYDIIPLPSEGADELFGGYLYFHKAPDAKSFHEETVRKLGKLHLYDCLRANKSLAAWGVEGRVPFLDKEFMDVAMTLNPEDKMAKDGKMEKWILRKAFEDYLPESVVWRQKEQFSDGVGYNWIDSLKALTAKKVSDEQMANAKFLYPINTPMSKEEYFYRSIFTEHFPSDAAASCVPSVPSIACSTPEALAWDASFRNNADPSGRSMKSVHTQAYK
jgi:asparagine synthase (glutamine-hydrolysing)